MILRPKNFKAYELVDITTYQKFGEDSFKFFRPELIRVLDELSAGFPGKAITINNWKAGGTMQWRGLRTRDCKDPKMADNGAHFTGAGIDFNVAGMKSDDAFHYIRENQPKFPSIRRLEDPLIAKSWTHADVYEHDSPRILIVKP